MRGRQLGGRQLWTALIPMLPGNGLQEHFPGNLTIISGLASLSSSPFVHTLLLAEAVKGTGEAPHDAAVFLFVNDIVEF